MIGRRPCWPPYAGALLIWTHDNDHVRILAFVRPGEAAAPAARWQAIAAEKNALLAERAVQIHPAELLANIHDPQIRVRMLDVRSETDFNLFHNKKVSLLTKNLRGLGVVDVLVIIRHSAQMGSLHYCLSDANRYH